MARQLAHKYQPIADLLTEARLDQSKKHIKIAQELRVPPSTIEQLETPSSSTIPESNMYGLYIRYAKYLEVDMDRVQLLMVDAAEATTKEGRRRKRSSVLPKHSIAVPKLGRYASILAVVGVIIGYAGLQIIGFNAPPRLEVTQPSEIHTTKEESVVVEGVSEADSSVFIAGQPITVAGDNSFSETLYLQPGINIVEVSAVDGFSKTSTKTLTVHYQEEDPVEEAASSDASLESR